MVFQFAFTWLSDFSGPHSTSWKIKSCMLRREFTVTYNLLVPYLLGVAQLDFRSLLDKLGVALHKLDAPLRVLLQVIKLILRWGEREKSFWHLQIPLIQDFYMQTKSDQKWVKLYVTLKIEDKHFKRWNFVLWKFNYLPRRCTNVGDVTVHKLMN